MIRDSKLMVMVVAVVVVNTVVLVVWEVADPYQVVLFNTEQKVHGHSMVSAQWRFGLVWFIGG